MSIFTDTMVEAIRKYRAMLRKHLPQAQRVNHLHQLDLKNPRLYSNEVMLYQLGYKIIDHLHQLDHTKNGYYSYSGISQFASHLQKFLDKYKLDDHQERVLHTSQLASRYLLKITQIVALSNSENTEQDLIQIQECHHQILECGSKEQIDLYKATLKNMLQKCLSEKLSIYADQLQRLVNQLEESKRSVA